LVRCILLLWLTTRDEEEDEESVMFDCEMSSGFVSQLDSQEAPRRLPGAPRMLYHSQFPVPNWFPG
jgi:hypothetical protein